MRKNVLLAVLGFTMAIASSTVQAQVPLTLPVGRVASRYQHRFGDFGTWPTGRVAGNKWPQKLSLWWCSFLFVSTQRSWSWVALAFGPVYGGAVPAALSPHTLLALFWACAFAFVEIISPKAFSLPNDSHLQLEGAYL